jgi:hypothetical protein
VGIPTGCATNRIFGGASKPCRSEAIDVRSPTTTKRSLAEPDHGPTRSIRRDSTSADQIRSVGRLGPPPHRDKSLTYSRVGGVDRR